MIRAGLPCFLALGLCSYGGTPAIASGQLLPAASPFMLMAKRRKKTKKRRKKKAQKPPVQKAKQAAPTPAPVAPAAPAPAPEPEAPESAAERFGERPGVAIMDITAMHGIEPGLAELLGGNLTTSLQTSGRFGSVISSTDVRALLSHEQQIQALGCNDSSCIAELGGALGVPLLVAPSLGAAGGKLILNVKVIAVDETDAVVRFTRLYPNEASLVAEIEDVGAAVAAMVFGEKNPLPPVPKVVQAEVKSKLPQILGGTLAVSGTVAFISSYFIASARQTDFDNTAQKDSAAVDELLGSQTMVSTLWGGGLLVGAAGAGLFTWGLLQ